MHSTLSKANVSNSEILSLILGQDSVPQHLTHQVTFIAAMTTILAGVAYADGRLEDTERKYVQQLLSQFASPESSLGETIRFMIKGICQHKMYAQPDSIKYLSQELCDAEKLVILCFGCKLASVDGHVELQEKRYLCKVAADMFLPAQYVATVFLLFEGNYTEANPDALKEVRCLLDPQRFRSIDPAIVKTASFLRSKLFGQMQSSFKGSECKKPSYERLRQFQEYQEQLSEVCGDLEKVVQSEEEFTLFPSILSEEIKRLTEKVRSQKFRVAVVGEFSQGKSTFLNALLGEEIQPVRAIPCSGTLTTLKYGPKRKVVCHYKDGRQTEIPFEAYQQQASIPEEAALGDRSIELANSDIAEIVFEHPGLELCKYHVEIVDSPGLNEHPDRTAVTERLLENVDAAIFLSNAQRPLTQSERELLQNLKARLTQNNPDGPAENLFVLVNFMDLLRSPKDKEQVQTLFKNFVLDKNAPLIKNDNRIHFISAQLALEGILDGQRNEYSDPFEQFVNALETFLVEERGELSLSRGMENTRKFTSGIQDGFVQTIKSLEGKLTLSASEKTKIVEKIGEVSGFDIKVQVLSNELFNEALEEVDKSWDEWLEGIDERLIEKMDYWTTNYEDKRRILRDYSEKFAEDISTDIDTWLQERVIQYILQPKVKQLENEIAERLKSVQQDLRSIDKASGTNLSEQFNLTNMGVSLKFSSNLDADEVRDPTGFWDGLGLLGGGAGAVVAGAFAPFFWPALVAGGISGIVIGSLFRDLDTVKEELKAKVFEKGAEKFGEAAEDILKNLVEKIELALHQAVQDFQQVTKNSISIMCDLLKQQENLAIETSRQKNVISQKIFQKQTQLAEIEASLKHIAEIASV